MQQKLDSYAFARFPTHHVTVREQRDPNGVRVENAFSDNGKLVASRVHDRPDHSKMMIFHENGTRSEVFASYKTWQVSQTNYDVRGHEIDTIRSGVGEGIVRYVPL